MEFWENFKKLTPIAQFGQIFLICIGLGLFSTLFLASDDTFGFGIVLEILAGTILLIAFDYLIAMEFYFIAKEKGYSEKKYFWYSFILTGLGYLMILALPNKANSAVNAVDELPEI